MNYDTPLAIVSAPESAQVLADLARLPPTRRQFGEWLTTDRNRRWRDGRRRQIRRAA